jgi:hypothetical protein
MWPPSEKGTYLPAIHIMLLDMTARQILPFKLFQAIFILCQSYIDIYFSFILNVPYL